jgi:predicted transglutaminase-like cysteine proteinase
MPLTKSALLRVAASLGLLVTLGPACAKLPAEPFAPAEYHYFAAPSEGDAWSAKIAAWQRRERTAATERTAASPASVSVPGAPSARDGEAGGPAALHEQYRSFRAEQRRALARQVALWIQAQARAHYLPDGAVDHWATLAETLERGGEDCDGLELLVNHLLRELGFGDDEVYRAIVYRPADGQHHMVTFWFEAPADPWVIDPTGAMTTGMPRMSELRDWVPLKVFSETLEFSVETLGPR